MYADWLSLSWLTLVVQTCLTAILVTRRLTISAAGRSLRRRQVLSMSQHLLLSLLRARGRLHHSASTCL